MRRAKGIYPLLLITVFSSMASFVFASISVSGDNIKYHGANKGDIFFDVVYGASSIYFDSGMLMLNNLNGLFSSIGFSCDTATANMTITKIESDEIDYTVNAETDVTSVTKIYVGSKGRPSNVSGATSWSYNSNLKIITVNVLHQSPADIGLEWTESDDGVPDWIIRSYSANMDMLWIMVFLMAAGLMLITLRGIPLEPILVIQLVIVSVMVFMGGIILLRFITHMP